MITLLTTFLLQSVHAESKICLIQNMECRSCVEMVRKNVCTTDLATCDVKIKDKKKRLGEIVFKTKDPAGAVDMKHVEDELAKMTYSVASCRDERPTTRR